MADVSGWAALAPGLKFTDSSLTGSVRFFGKGRDIDVLVKVTRLDDAAQCLDHSGWVLCGDYTGNPGWLAFRKGRFNLIVCAYDSGHYEAMDSAAILCTLLAERGVLTPADRETRVLIHKFMRDEL